MAKRLVSIRLEQTMLDYIQSNELGLTQTIESALNSHLHNSDHKQSTILSLLNIFENIPPTLYSKLRNPKNQVVFTRYLLFLNSDPSLKLLDFPLVDFVKHINGKKITSVVLSTSESLDADVAIAFVKNEKTLHDFLSKSKIEKIGAIRSDENLVFAFKVSK